MTTDLFVVISNVFDPVFLVVNSSCPSLLPVVISRRQKRVQLMRIREKDTKKRQQAGGQEGTYRRKATPVKRYAGDLLAPVSGTQLDMCRSDFYQFSVVRKKKTIYICCRGFSAGHHHCTSFTSPSLFLLLPRATCKACETNRWTQALPLAASVPQTKL